MRGGGRGGKWKEEATDIWDGESLRERGMLPRAGW